MMPPYVPHPVVYWTMIIWLRLIIWISLEHSKFWKQKGWNYSDIKMCMLVIFQLLWSITGKYLGNIFQITDGQFNRGTRPSSILFCYGLYPHLDWLENRLQAIPLTSSSEVYKLKAYVDDVKHSISNMHEFSIVDQGSALFEAASGCK